MCYYFYFQNGGITGVHLRPFYGEFFDWYIDYASSMLHAMLCFATLPSTHPRETPSFPNMTCMQSTHTSTHHFSDPCASSILASTFGAWASDLSFRVLVHSM